MATEEYSKQSEYEERVLEIKRVSKKNKGGNKIGFTALVVVGDKNGKVGSGLGKASDVPSAIRKGVNVAKRNVVGVNLDGSTIPHEVTHKYASAQLFMKPAPEGSGVIAGGVVRHVMELVGVSDVSAKCFGSSNRTANVRCAIEALAKLKPALNVSTVGSSSNKGKDETE